MAIQTRRLPPPRRWPALCLALALPLSASAAPLPPSAPAAPAAPAALPAGDWRGSLALDARRMAAVQLLQKAGKTRLQFGAPLNCGLNLLAQDGAAYRLESINGGIYCDRLLGKTLTAQRSADDLQLRIDGTPLPLLLHSLPAPASALQGNWRLLAGTSGASRPAALTLKIAATPLAPGAAVATLRYGSPRDCQIEARYAGTRDTSVVLSLGVNDAGYCGRLSDGQAELQPQQDGNVSLQIFDRLGTRADSGTLQRMP
ncbi:hypothetical protein ISN35_16975 [Xanthomonas translucens pv. undulosa]|uniref:hypothetical protein n=1 Tax=Xanthomonas campestris pv. translucens TaxID=343 RepID=UPI00071E9A52|nr:hypothetical protein [Xanthomonas translucens]QEO26798.1 hypothetical protein F0H32_11840 [Xanthomonas translucens pv. undulosa]QSQ40116.1 hypothetical protein ISN33_10460 [Xanthomonas translucens pv. translucens]QSQ48686.1 hypothetical protein ISN35_16975 [Xanthomonas translucens pv. undulosa]WKZ99602.1 hypothetical protein MO330_11905 [Xanthomonas translucens]